MPARIAVGVARRVEIVGSLVILRGRRGRSPSAFGAVVYRRAIVRTGRRLRFREVLRSA